VKSSSTETYNKAILSGYMVEIFAIILPSDIYRLPHVVCAKGIPFEHAAETSKDIP